MAGLNDARRRLAALLALTGACALWGLSFPVMRALQLAAPAREPAAATWAVAAWCLCLRFTLAAAAIALVLGRRWRGWRAAELAQGCAFGVFTGIGLLLQMDALAYTSASASAFLTQAYCVALPLVGAVAARRPPSPRVVLAVALVMAGVAILAQVDWRALRLGRGEAETLLGAASFALQILSLERRAWAGNDAARVSLVAFAVLAALSAPVALAGLPATTALRLFAAPDAAACVIGLALLPTALAMWLQNRCQPIVGAVPAALLYASEPVFAAVSAWFLPGWLSAAMG
ncbi:MAG TPA: DMT family transporter, partial [Kofleriaceae bacterium]|nr:DMT family transporter [Kofleriaceae bacterium]